MFDLLPSTQGDLENDFKYNNNYFEQCFIGR